MSSGAITRAGICAGAAVVLVVAPATAAFGNAANPTSAKATVWQCGDQGAPVDCTSGAVVKVAGTWSWGELASQKRSPQKDCAGRYGVGWSVDWWGMSESPTAASIPGLRGSTVTAATKTTAPAASWGDLTPAGVWQVKGSNTYFHTSAPFNGFLADLCNNATQTSTGPEGSFESVAVYPSRNAIPPKLCVNFYDPHGKQGQWSTKDDDNYASEADDNSIKTNDFDPSSISGYCLVPQDAPQPQQPPAKPQQPPAKPHVVVGKTGPSTGTAGGTGTYTIALSNDGDAAKDGPTSFVDELPVGLQIIAPALHETTMFALGSAFEAARAPSPRRRGAP